MFWKLSQLDGLFYAFLIAAALAGLLFVLSWLSLINRHVGAIRSLRAIRRTRRHIFPLLIGMAAIFGTIITYGSLRNQMLQNAENASNSLANEFIVWERENRYIRCLYTWDSGFVDHRKCFEEIIPDPDKLSEVTLYIEEVFFFLEQSARYEEIYESPYSQDIQYWRRDIEEDPTNLFSFTFRNIYGRNKVAQAMASTGVNIPGLNRRHAYVASRLEQISASQSGVK